MKDKVSGAIAIPKAAEPDSRGFSKKDVSNYEPQANKVF